MQKDLKVLQEALEELRHLSAEFRSFLNFQCGIFPLGCYECNTCECPNHVRLRVLAWEIGRIFLNTGIRPAEEMLLLLLKSRNESLKINGVFALEKARTSGEFLTLRALLELDKFKRSIINWDICKKVDYILRAMNAYLN
ncbi:MAG: hypothetical protein A2V69_02195 [Candidatus Portnoybacteria bacterium RBG_13_40_8]|uniref:Uncharacterized protein n=1 Tax=Candidatus Portnoybacteria bacterium RBG_13_40_8 TaxID=1801990 RepID=A0A1G2F370_9BACT|nr:MAG: hypothetical protein A2V69_02195 [Candidatus Portnoybacteria bacterium RBG_13_40_8]OGZ35041.1 MAG: hypothetical protein A2V60_01360 [Candidatus Portnoybacteria bacterium RIFCSPHIGHO2_01_FULL_39_19]